MKGKINGFYTAIGILIIFGCVYVGIRGGTLIYPDEKEYDLLARNIINHGTLSWDGVNPTAERTPGLPLVLATLYKMGAGIGSALFFNYILLSATICMLSKLFEEGFSEWSIYERVLLAFSPMVYPVVFYNAGTFYPQTICAFLMVFALLFVKTISSEWGWSIVGIAGGFLVLCSPNYYYYIPLIVLYLWMTGRFKWNRVLLIAVGCALVFSPWIWRNWEVFHHVIPVSTNGGLNLLLGNNAYARADSGVNVPLDKICTEKFETPLNEVEKDQYFRHKAVEWIREYPKDAVILYAKKVLNHFNYWNQFATESEASSKKKWIMGFTYYGMLAFVGIRLWFVRRKPLSSQEKFALVSYASTALAMAVFFTRIRFRLPFDVLLLPVAVHGMYLLRKAIFRSRMIGRETLKKQA